LNPLPDHGHLRLRSGRNQLPEVDGLAGENFLLFGILGVHISFLKIDNGINNDLAKPF